MSLCQFLNFARELNWRFQAFKRRRESCGSLQVRFYNTFFPFVFIQCSGSQRSFFVFLCHDILLLILIILKENTNQPAVLSEHHKTLTCTHIWLLNRLQIKTAKLKSAFMFTISRIHLNVSQICCRK